MAIGSDYMLHSGDFFLSSLSKLWAICAVTAIVNVAVFNVYSHPSDALSGILRQISG